MALANGRCRHHGGSDTPRQGFRRPAWFTRARIAERQLVRGLVARARANVDRLLRRRSRAPLALVADPPVELYPMPPDRQ